MYDNDANGGPSAADHLRDCYKENRDLLNRTEQAEAFIVELKDTLLRVIRERDMWKMRCNVPK